jgi:BMFP domain-containing protein YqiC
MDNSRILDDLTRVAGGAFSVFSALGKQLQNNLKDQMGDKFSSSSNTDDVTRLQGVVTKLRMEQEDLKSRIAELETMLGKKAAPKTASKAKAKSAPAASTKAKAKTSAKTKAKKRA